MGQNLYVSKLSPPPFHTKYFIGKIASPGIHLSPDLEAIRGRWVYEGREKKVKNGESRRVA